MADQKTLTIQLGEPITHNGKTYESLTFRRRRAKDLVVMDKVQGQVKKHMAMLASMADVPLPVIEDLDGDDFDRVAEETVPLMGKSAVKAMADAKVPTEEKASASDE